MKQPTPKKRQTKKDKEEEKKDKKDFQISPLYWKVEK